MAIDVSDARICELLDPPLRVRIGSSIAGVGRKIKLGLPRTRWAPPPATIDWAPYLVALGSGIGLGVAGNAAYDAAKLAIRSVLNRTGGEPTVVEPLRYDEALAVALWSLVRSFRENPRSVQEKSAELDSSGQWTFLLTRECYTYEIVVPAGVPNVREITVTRRRETRD